MKFYATMGVGHYEVFARSRKRAIAILKEKEVWDNIKDLWNQTEWNQVKKMKNLESFFVSMLIKVFKEEE